jgi:hypothetical protein
VLTWDQAELFLAAAPKLKSDRHTLPLTLSFSMSPGRLELGGLTGVASAGVELVEGLLEGGEDKEGKKLIADVGPYLRKAVPSVSALLAEISEGSFSLFSMEGFLLLLPKEEVWRGRIKSKLEWRGVKVGEFSFGIEVAGL